MSVWQQKWHLICSNPQRFMKQGLGLTRINVDNTSCGGSSSDSTRGWILVSLTDNMLEIGADNYSFHDHL